MYWLDAKSQLFLSLLKLVEFISCLGSSRSIPRLYIFMKLKIENRLAEVVVLQVDWTDCHLKWQDSLEHLSLVKRHFEIIRENHSAIWSFLSLIIPLKSDEKAKGLIRSSLTFWFYQEEPSDLSKIKLNTVLFCTS